MFVWFVVEHPKVKPGFIQAILSKNSRTFQGLLKDFPTVFKDKFMKNTDFSVKCLLQKC